MANYTNESSLDREILEINLRATQIDLHIKKLQLEAYLHVSKIDVTTEVGLYNLRVDVRRALSDYADLSSDIEKIKRKI